MSVTRVFIIWYKLLLQSPFVGPGVPMVDVHRATVQSLLAYNKSAIEDDNAIQSHHLLQAFAAESMHCSESLAG